VLTELQQSRNAGVQQSAAAALSRVRGAK
jgi:hypothetical protein